MKKERKMILMWQILEPNGKPLGFMTIQEDIAKKLCEAVKGRKMQQVAVKI